MLPPNHQISDHLRAVPRHDPFERGGVWWDLEVLSPRGEWVSVQSGPAGSSLWANLGVNLPF
jgi:hypothetical protein